MKAEFDEVFVRLRGMMLAAAPQMKVKRDEHGSLELRTPDIDPKTKQLTNHFRMTATGWAGR